MKFKLQSNKLLFLSILSRLTRITRFGIYGYEELISNHGGNVNNIIISEDGINHSVLQYAVKYGNLGLVKYLIEEKGADVNATSNDGASALHAKGADVNATSNDGASALHAKGADVKANYISGVKANYLAGDSVLHYAVRYGNLDLVKYLVEEKGADVKATNNSGDSVLHYAVVSGNLDIVKYLIEAKGADVKATDKYGVSVLTRAASCKGLDIVKYLIEAKGADVNATSNDGASVLHYAMKYGNLNLVKYLIEAKGADVNAASNDGVSVLHYAVRYRNLDLVKYLIEEKGANITVDKNGNSLLHRAVLKNLEIVKYLIEEKGADVNANNKLIGKGHSVLFYAVFGMNLDIVKYLIEKGANVNVIDNMGNRTILDAAKWSEDSRLVDCIKDRMKRDRIKGPMEGDFVPLGSIGEFTTRQKLFNSWYNTLSSISIAGILNFGSYMKDMLPERMSQAWGGVSNSLAKMQGLETIVNGVSESLGMSAKAANALKANFILTLPITIMIAAGKAISNFMKARKRRVGVLDATAESLYDTGALLAQSTAGVAGAALGAAVIGGVAAPLVASFVGGYGIGEIARHAKPVASKFTAKIASEVSSKLGYSK